MYHNLLLYKFRPILWFHHNEEYYPTRFENYITNCKIIYNKDLLYTNPTISEFNYTIDNYKNNLITLKPNKINEDKQITVYCHCREYDEYYDLLYIFFYIYNDFNRCLCVHGNHDADLEHITVRVNKKYEKIEKIYFGAHGYNDGIVVSSNRLETSQDRPIIYIAKGSHAIYPTNEIFFRFCCFGNDYTEKGKMILEYHLEELTKDSLLVKYTGKLGPNTASLTLQSWFYEESWVNNSNCIRCCPIKKILSKI